MDWVEQAENMMKTWAEAQKTMWDGWYEMARNAQGPEAFRFGAPDLTSTFKRSMDAFTAGPGETPDRLAGDFVNSQRAMVQTLELLSKAWGVVVPHMQSGSDWQPDLKSFVDQWTQQFLGAPTRASESVNDVGELWRSFAGEWGPLLQPWIASMKQMAQGHLGESMLLGGLNIDRVFGVDSHSLSQVLSMEREGHMAFEQLAEIPRIGATREYSADILRAFDAFVDLRNAVTRYRTLVGEVLNDAVQRTMTHLTEVAAEGNSIDSIRELNRVWVQKADDAFTDLYSSEQYSVALHELSSASMRNRIAQRTVIEMVLKAVDIPTRSELDDAYKTLYELRKEVKALKKMHKEQAPARRPRKKASVRVTNKTAAKSTASGRAGKTP